MNQIINGTGTSLHGIEQAGITGDGTSSEACRDGAIQVYVAFRNKINMTCSLVEIHSLDGLHDSVAIKIQSSRISPAEIYDRLASGQPSIMGYISQNSFHLDFRYIREEEVSDLLRRLKIVLEIES